MVIKTALSRVAGGGGGGGSAAARTGYHGVPTSEIKIESATRGATATFVSDMSTPAVHSPEQRSPLPYDCVALKKKVNVTVTILSIAGLCVKDAGRRGRGMSFRRRSSKRLDASPPPCKIDTTGAASEMDTSTLTSGTPGADSAAAVTVVASFSRTAPAKGGKSKTVMAHVPSLPLPLSSSAGRGKDKDKDKPATLSSVIHWPEPDPAASVPSVSDGMGEGTLGLSSYQFHRTFQREDASDPKSGHRGPSRHSERFVPQPLDIQVALSRRGKMFRIGMASVLLSGEENGESSINVPVRNATAAAPKGGKFPFRSGGSGDSGDKAVPMIKLKGDTLKCGLDPNATLRVLVHVSDIGETLDLSPRLTVTMVSTAKEKERKRKKRGGRASLVSIPTLSSPGESQDAAPPKKFLPKPRESSTAASDANKPTSPKTPGEESANKEGVQASLKTPDTNGNVNVVAKDAIVEETAQAEDKDSDDWEYNPTLATIVVNSPDTNGNVDAAAEDDDELAWPVCKVLTLQNSTLRDEELENTTAEEGEDTTAEGADGSYGDFDEPSCTSSAYMSDAGHFGCRSRSSATRTTASSALSSLSDLTDHNSWVSQTGVEVVPSSSIDGVATDQGAAAAVDYALPPDSRLRDYLKEEEGGRRRAMGRFDDDYGSTTVDDSDGLSSFVDADDRERRRTFFPHRRKPRTWRQRIACGVLPACGPSPSYDVDDDDAEDPGRRLGRALSLVEEEDEEEEGRIRRRRRRRASSRGRRWNRRAARRDPIDARPSYCTDDDDDEEEEEASTDGEEGTDDDSESER